MTQAYARSLQGAFRQHGGLRDFGKIFAELPQQVQAMYPLDVVAITNAQVIAPADKDETVFVASTLTLQGYDAEMSQALYSSLLKDHPNFSIEKAMLMPKDMMVETYGVMYGQMLIDTLLDTASQPVLYALLAERIGHRAIAVERTCLGVVFVSRADTLALRRTNRSYRQLESSDITPWQIRDSKVIPPGEADAIFYQLTRCRLPRVVPIHPPSPLAENYASYEEIAL